MEKFILVDNKNKIATIEEDKNSLIDRIELLEKNNIDYLLYNFSKYIIEVLEIEEIKFCLEVEDIFYFSTYEEYSKFCDSYF